MLQIKKKLVLMAITGMTIGLLAGCGGSGNTADDYEDEPQQKQETQTKKETTAFAEDEDPYYDLLEDAYDSLVDFYNQAYDIYSSDSIPQDDDIEDMFSNVQERMDAVHDPDGWANCTKEEYKEYMQEMADITADLQDGINRMYDLEDEHKINDSDIDLVEKNLDAIYDNYNSLVEFFNRSNVSMTQWQSDMMDQVSDEIDELKETDPSSFTDMDDLVDYYNDTLTVLDHIQQITDSI